MQTAWLREVLCVALVPWLATGNAVAWQSAGGEERDRANWEKVRAIGPDRQIEVEIRSPNNASGYRTYRGRLVGWEPGSLLLELKKGGTQEISKSLVRNVWVKHKRSRGKAAAIGGAVGFGGGMGIGVAAFPALDSHGGAGQRIGLGVGFGLVFGGIGALIGALAGDTGAETVYHQ